MDKVPFKDASHVWYDRDAKMLHCDRCPHQEELYEGDPSGHIAAYASAHRDCPEVATDASREEAKNRVFQAGSRRGFGL